MKSLGLVALAMLFLQPVHAQEIPAGTTLPIMLSSTLDARKAKPGQKITGKLMQAVPLPTGAQIPAGARLLGIVVAVTPPTNNQLGSRVTVAFDRLTTAGHTYPITVHLRSLASMSEVFEAQMPTNAFDDYGTSPADWNTIQIGGDVVYRGAGLVFSKYNEAVGKATVGGAVTAHLQAVPAAGCHDGFDASRGQALWVFSASACGVYGFADLQIRHAGRTTPVGQIELQSNGNVHLSGGSGWLLRANSAGAQSNPK